MGIQAPINTLVQNSYLTAEQKNIYEQPALSGIAQYHRRGIKTRSDQAAQCNKNLNALLEMGKDVRKTEMIERSLHTVSIPTEAYIREQTRLTDKLPEVDRAGRPLLLSDTVMDSERTTPFIVKRQPGENERSSSRLLTLGREGKAIPSASDHLREVSSIFHDVSHWDFLPGKSSVFKAHMVFCRGDRLYATIFILLGLACLVLVAHILIKVFSQ